MRDAATTWRFGRVRPAVWALLAGALLVAALVPSTRLWQVAHTALEASAQVWPPVPRVGQATRILLTLPDPNDRAAVEAPGAQIVTRWDMTGMEMGVQQVTVSGDAHAAVGPLAAPLCLDMPGSWWARVEVRAPGRPVWRTVERFIVLPPDPANTPQGAPASGAGASACVALREGSAST